MDSQIVSAIITGVATIIAGIIGISFSREAFRGTRKQDLFEEQLILVFEPLEVMFELNIPPDLNKLLLSTEKILSEHYRIVPHQILESFVQVKGKEDIAWEDFTEFRKLIASSYNWLLRRFGYPYNYSKIIRTIPLYCYIEQDLIILLKEIGYTLFFLSVLLLTLYGIAAWYNLNIPYSIPDIGRAIVAVFLGLFLLFDDIASLLLHKRSHSI